MTVVLVEQNARSALSVSHHAVILNLGQVVVSDDASDGGRRRRPAPPLPRVLAP